MDHDHRQEAEQEVEPEIAESPPGVDRPNDTIAVHIPIHAVLLHDRLRGVNVVGDWKMGGTDVVRVLFSMADTPFGVLGTRGDRCAGKVRALDNLVGVYPAMTLASHWSLRGHQSVSGLEWYVIHVVSDRVDERKERGEEGRRGGGCAHADGARLCSVSRKTNDGIHSIPMTSSINSGSTFQVFSFGDSNVQNTINKASSLVLLRPPTRGDLAAERNTLPRSLHACKDANLGVADEVYNHHGPTGV